MSIADTTPPNNQQNDDHQNDPDRLEDHHASRFETTWGSSVHGIIEAGRVLREAQDRLPRGRFASWVESRHQRTRRSVEMLIAIAADPRIANHGSPPTLWRPLYEITRLSDEDVPEAHIARMARTWGMTPCARAARQRS